MTVLNPLSLEPIPIKNTIKGNTVVFIIPTQVLDYTNK